MVNYSTLGHNLKRGIFNFCNKLSKGMKKPTQKFIADMIYGIIASKSSYLTEMARKLNEKIALDKTVERLSRNLMSFEDVEILTNNYLSTISSHFDKNTVLLVDDSDIAKPYSQKLEGLCRVKDGSTGEFADGYWFAGVSALTANHKQPIPVYSRVYSSKEDGYKGNNVETLKSLQFMSNHFPKANIRAFDRGYDAGYIFDHLITNGENFIVRSVGKRHCIYKGETIAVSTLAGKFKGKYTLKYKTREGRSVNCKISIMPILLPKYPNTPLNLVICRGFGKEPLMLITNLSSDDSRLGVTISKVYLMRWRIEEYYRFKKQGFGFEKFLVRSLDSIRNLDLLLSIAIGYIGTLSEKVNDSMEVMQVIHASKRLYGLAKFTFYAISDGLAEIFSKSYVGLQAFFRTPAYNPQLSLFDCA
jgi:hypothetical protein